ncbi:DUF6894 family protein [Methylobacterium iners]|uniref:DUF6894 domain-containing protein n=1 Tax=Methylobacterium iners TaxID=418707 RepID=A0ABQ4S456_9HYPH|nr:hypothetical protein [Methylobacterium iners]GJD97841.1 hypothetical protein OCOJLMKI_5080 [Methylobacterium iners]
MSRGRYRFHLTNGREALIDREGTLLRSEARIWSHAVAVAQDAMGSCGGRFDWSDWLVDVHDATGRRVLILAFADVGDLAMAA